MYIPRPIYPHPKGEFKSRPTSGDLHETGGLAGNWALDFMAPGGTAILAPQDCLVIRLSGHDPRQGVVEGDVFGWSTYLHVPDGFYFLTHQGIRFVKEGQWVRKGTLIGRVGHWPGDPGRSHSHLGFTHVKGKSASVDRILHVANGPVKPDPSL